MTALQPGQRVELRRPCPEGVDGEERLVGTVTPEGRIDAGVYAAWPQYWGVERWTVTPLPPARPEWTTQPMAAGLDEESGCVWQRGDVDKWAEVGIYRWVPWSEVPPLTELRPVREEQAQ